MQQPARTKYRKQQKGRNNGMATRGTKVSFGEFGLKAITSGRLTARQIEAARIAITRKIRKYGRMWIRMFPDKPLTKKPAEVRMGKGKGSPEMWVANVSRGKMMYEVADVSEELAVEALTRAAHKLPVTTKIIKRGMVVS